MSDKSLTIASRLNQCVSSVMTSTQLEGFEKAYLIAEATANLKDLLTAEYMKPIMQLQGNKLGFKTDKDQHGGYPEAVVKNCLIEAVLTGVQPFGNQFNIIAGNCYITKEGFGYLLKNYAGLSYKITPALPRISNDKTSAAIDMQLKWSINGGSQFTETLPIPVKMNAHMGTDAVIGKATRKARAWLYNTITGSEISDGDISDVEGRPTIVIPEVSEAVSTDKENERILKFIAEAKTKKELLEAEPFVQEGPVKEAFDAKMKEVK